MLRVIKEDMAQKPAASEAIEEIILSHLFWVNTGGVCATSAESQLHAGSVMGEGRWRQTDVRVSLMNALWLWLRKPFEKGMEY